MWTTGKVDMVPTRGRSVDPDVRSAIQGGGSKGLSPGEIHTALSQDPDFYGRVPSLRTVQRILSEGRPRDTSGRWTIQSNDGDRVRVVLDALAAVIEQTRGRVNGFTKEEADWIARLDRAAPGLPPFELWRIARLYIGRLSRNEPTDDLDALLAFAPWRGELGTWTSWPRYDNAVEAGWINAAPRYLTTAILTGEAGSDQSAGDGNE
jgi:hypothetical protein